MDQHFVMARDIKPDLLRHLDQDQGGHETSGPERTEQCKAAPTNCVALSQEVMGSTPDPKIEKPTREPTLQSSHKSR